MDKVLPTVKVLHCYMEGNTPMIQYESSQKTIKACHLNYNGHCPLPIDQIDHYLKLLSLDGHNVPLKPINYSDPSTLVNYPQLLKC